MLLYADYIILLCPTITGLQKMLDVCIELSGSVNLQFNGHRSHCIAFGKSVTGNLHPMRLWRNNLGWCKSIKCLGVHIVSGSNISFNIYEVMHSFFSCMQLYF